MPNDSLNILTDFDLCLALSQAAINSQMAYAWRAWKRRKHLSDTINIFKVKDKDGQLKDSHFGLSAQMEPLTVGLNVADGKLGQVQVTLHLRSGTVTYYDEINEDQATAPIVDWSISFITDLDKKPVDLQTLAQIDPEVAQHVQDHIAATALPDAVFSIEYLWLKFTEVDLVLADNKHIVMPADVPSDARTKALSCLNLLLQGDLGNFMLGTVVRRNNKQATPTFALTDFLFDVHANWSVANAATLQYLGMLAQRGLPADPNAARLRLPAPWVRPEAIDGSAGLIAGVMAIRKEVLLDNHLMPKFVSALGQQPTVNGLARSFAHGDTRSQSYTDLVEHTLDISNAYSLQLAIQPGSANITIAGSITSEIVYKELLLGTRAESAKIDAAGTCPITGTLCLTASGSGIAFQVNATLDYSIGAFSTTKSAISGFAVVENALSHVTKAFGITGNTLEEQFTTVAQNVASSVRNALETSLRRVNVDLSHQAFIPPGGGVFDFQNVHFSDVTGDVMFDVIYQAP